MVYHSSVSSEQLQCCDILGEIGEGTWWIVGIKVSFILWEEGLLYYGNPDCKASQAFAIHVCAGDADA